MTTIFKPARIKQVARRFVHSASQRLRFSNWLRRDEDAIAYNDLLERSKRQTPVFVYQMGKVGSTSIYESLKQRYGGNVLHAHTFGPFHSSAEVRALFRYHHAEQAPIKIITLVREPVTRNLSAFFQNFRRDTGQSVENCQLDAFELKKTFMNSYPHEIPLVWFDNNLLKHFQIDVYETPFPECGYVEINQSQTEVLVMRHDLPDETKKDLIGKFVGLKDFVIEHHNIGAEKQYAHLYAKLQQAKLPLEHLYYLASSKYMHHFFHNDMREIIFSWSDQPVGDTNRDTH